MKYLLLLSVVVAGLWAGSIFAYAQDDLSEESATCSEVATTIEDIREDIRQLRSSILRDCFSSAARRYSCYEMRREVMRMRKRRMAWEKWSVDNCSEEG